MYLLDNDAAKKLCQYELISTLISSLGCQLSDFGVLPQLKYQLRLNVPNKALEKLGTNEAVKNAELLIASAKEVEISAEAANFALVLSRPDLDSGEVTLFAAVCERCDDSLLSGDKRAFIALSKVAGLPQLDEVWPRLLCLEEAMILILAKTCFDTVSSKVRSKPAVDMGLSIAFGRSVASNKAAVLQALHSYLNDLRNKTGGRYILPIVPENSTESGPA